MEKQTSFIKSQPSKKIISNPIEIFVDGASRGNPGPAGAGILIKQADKNLVKTGIYLGEKTNNQAEYLALALAVFFLNQKVKASGNVIITSDSELLIKQMRGEYKVKNPILSQIQNLINSMLIEYECKFRHVLREKNKIADELANKGIDSKQKPPLPFISLIKKHKISI